MNKNIIIMGMLLLCLNLNMVAINIGGIEKQIDTLESRMIGPGVRYTKFRLPDYPLSAYLLTIDLTDPYNFVETFQAGNQVGKTEAMTSAFNRLSTELHTPLAGVNGNFWIVANQGQPTELLGVPHSGSILNGEILTDPNNWNRGHGLIGFAMIDSNKKVWIDDIAFVGKVKISTKGEFPISQINRIRASNELVLFNRYLGTGKTTRTDNSGTEVFIKLADNSKSKTNEDVKYVVTRIIANQGANLLEEGESVLSGSGTAQTFLSNLSQGDTLSVNMSIKTLTDNKFPLVEQMITGNALVMKNGTLTNRNYNEAYNTQLYPRTGIGSSQDGKTLFLIVIDKGVASVGANTETMCGILKAYGAYNATSLDGGGSAQMMVEGIITSNPSDGKERPVANGWFLYQNAPNDENVTRIEFDDLRRELPASALYKPTILGYNQFGVLINKNIIGYTLSCSEGLGEISENGAFVANGSATYGTLTVTYNSVSVTKTLNITPGAIALRLDSILIDDKFEYPIEVQSIYNNDILSIPPSLLTWTVQDNTICRIDNGVLKGLKNGKTQVYGVIGNTKDTLLVTVEIPADKIITYDDFGQTLNTWNLTASSQLSASLSTSGIPASWTSGMAVNFIYKSGRAPYVKLSNQKPLYSIPDSIVITLNNADILIEKVLISLRANNDKKPVLQEFNNFTTNSSDTKITFALSDFFDTNDIAVFPLWFDNINFYLKAQTENTSYSLAFKEISLVYKDIPFSGVDNPSESKTVHVYPNPVNGTQIYVKFQEQVNQIDYEIFNVSGQKVMSQQSVSVNSDIVTIPALGLEAGCYFLTIKQNQQRSTLKIIKR